MLIHATVTVTGDPLLLSACEARLERLLAGMRLKNELTEHHGENALCYDLKIEGGIPFPLFAQASQEFPDLTFEAAWVNVAAGEKGTATLVAGRVTAQASERVSRAADPHPVHVEVRPDGRLQLALTVFRATREEWRGYAVTSDRDALFRLRREGDGTVELLATEGAAEWSLAWRRVPESAPPACEALASPVTIDEAEWRELEAMARAFAAEWIWFAADRDAEIAIERDRYSRYGYAVHAANVRAAQLHRMRSEAAPDAPLVYSKLGGDERWIRDVVAESWAGGLE